MNKTELRAKYKSLRNSLDEKTRKQWSGEICENILAMPQFAATKVLAGYWPLGSEADVTAVLKETILQNKTLALPVSHDDGTLTFRRVQDFSELVKGKFGILAPKDSCAPVPPCGIDFMLVPGLVFDHAGYRVGYGKGYYDRALAEVRADCMTCGTAFGMQIIPFLSPEAFDIPVKMVIYNRR